MEERTARFERWQEQARAYERRLLESAGFDAQDDRV
jgi:hypothetical protein